MRLRGRVVPGVLCVFVGAFIVLGGAGCGGSGAAPDRDAYFEAMPYATPACNGVDQSLAGLRQMRLFTRVGAGPVLPVTRGMASYYHRHALSFFTAEQPLTTSMAYAVDTDENALSRALVAAFPNVDLNDDAAVMSDPVLYNQILTFIANFMLRPMVDFANTHSDAGGSVTNLILVGQLERPGGMSISDPGTSLAGLAISPALLAEFAQQMPDEAQIWAGVTLPPDFTPMMVLGNDVLTRARALDPILDDLVAAHEFGHTGALLHTMASDNLMFPSASPSDDCTVSLDDAQLARMAASYGLGPNAALQLKRPAPVAPAPAARPLSSSFAPARMRAMLAGDGRAARAFLELLFH